MELQLTYTDWLVGDAMTLADIALSAPLTYAVPAQLPLDDYPGIKAWTDDLVPWLAATLPTMLDDGDG